MFLIHEDCLWPREEVDMRLNIFPTLATGFESLRRGGVHVLLTLDKIPGKVLKAVDIVFATR